MQKLWQEPDPDRKSLCSFVLFGLRGMAAYSYHARVLGYTDGEIDLFFCTALRAIAQERDKDKLFQLVEDTGRMAYRVMAELDKANTGAFGDPEPVEVPLTIEKGPFIVISGHDLYDAKCLLEQTEGKGINIYTHSEMLPAHGYPELKKRFPHLKGNFGTAWQNQQREFEDIPAPVLFTTNCIMPLRPSYADRVFTTSVVSYPGVTHIGEDRDFSPVIAKALELGGYPEDTLIPGMNGGSVVTTGFAHHAVLSHAEEIVQAVHEGAIRHFFLIGGCDGTRPSRRYYTDFAKLTPSDTVILTLACGKFRLNDLPLGTVAGLPRILDVGQCNDAYSAIRIALGLAEAFDCSVNELPLSIILCWFEQKAVCVLMALLALGIRGIRLGPTLPAFLSPGVAAVLQEKYDLRPITTPEDDLAACLGRHWSRKGILFPTRPICFSQEEPSPCTQLWCSCHLNLFQHLCIIFLLSGTRAFQMSLRRPIWDAFLFTGIKRDSAECAAALPGYSPENRKRMGKSMENFTEQKGLWASMTPSSSTTPAASVPSWTSRAARATRPSATRCPSWSALSTAPARTPRARPATAWASCCRSATASLPRWPTS